MFFAADWYVDGLIPGSIVDDVLIIVDCHFVGHAQGGQIEVHFCVADGDALEGLNCGFEGFDGDADLSFAVFIPAFLQ